MGHYWYWSYHCRPWIKCDGLIYGYWVFLLFWELNQSQFELDGKYLTLLTDWSSQMSKKCLFLYSPKLNWVENLPKKTTLTFSIRFCDIVNFNFGSFTILRYNLEVQKKTKMWILIWCGCGCGGLDRWNPLGWVCKTQSVLCWNTQLYNQISKR